MQVFLARQAKGVDQACFGVTFYKHVNVPPETLIGECTRVQTVMGQNHLTRAQENAQVGDCSHLGDISAKLKEGNFAMVRGKKKGR